jgi:hypothetical protein
MRRGLFCVSLLLSVAALMGANFLVSQVQAEISGILQDKLGMESLPGGNPGAEQSFKVTDAVVKKLEEMKENGDTIEVDAELEYAELIQAALNSLHLKQQKKTDDGGAYKFDVTDATIKKLKGKTISVFATGKVKVK